MGSSALCRIRNKLQDFFSESTAEMITVLLVVINTLFMCLEQHPMDPNLEAVLSVSNKVYCVCISSDKKLK